MLDETIAFLDSRQIQDKSFTYEVIVIDDGSKDRTTKVALEYSKKYSTDRVRVLTLVKNRGKGGAVQLGMLCTRGRKCLFADADGATKFSDIEKLEKSLQAINTREDNMAIACGSRRGPNQAVVQRTIFRKAQSYFFYLAVCALHFNFLRETQCGFKLMTRETALKLFTNIHLNGWAFDIELLFLADALKIPVSEVTVHWTEIDGSKMIPVFSILQMIKDLVLMRLKYLLGIWHINDKVKLHVD